MNDPGVLKDIEKKHRAFSTGSQYADWSSRNCDSCKKGFDRKAMRFRCTWEFALALSTVDKNGTVPAAVARAIGYLDNEGCYIWECPAWARR